MEPLLGVPAVLSLADAQAAPQRDRVRLHPINKVCELLSPHILSGNWYSPTFHQILNHLMGEGGERFHVVILGSLCWRHSHGAEGERPPWEADVRCPRQDGLPS